MKLLRALALFAFLATIAAQSRLSLSITMVDGETGKAIPQAQVTIAPADSPATLSLVADDAGRIATTVAPGTLSVKVRHPNYLPAEYGQPSWNKPGAPLQVTATESRVVIKMTPYAAIHGTVVDQKGSSLAGIRVEALSPRYGEGERYFHEVGKTTTDDRGEFRIWGLQPDSYVLWVHTEHRLPRVEGPNDIARNAASNYVPPILTMPTYYPGATSDPAQSPLIEIRPGVTHETGNLRLESVAPVHVRGQVIDAITGKPVSKGQVMVLDPQLKWFQLEGVTLDLGPRYLPLSASGTFDFYGLPPGTHRLVARDEVQKPQARGVATVTVNSADVDGLQISVKSEESFKIEGRLLVEGESREDGRIRFEPVQVRLQGDYTRSTYMRVRADGTFTMTGIGAEPYKLIVSELPANWYVRKAELEGRDVLASGVHLNHAPEQHLLITLAPNAAALQFTVRDDKRNAIHGARVVMLPVGPFSQLILHSFSDQSGNGRITGIPPGEYKVFAWDGVKDGEWTYPPFISKYDSIGSRIRITPGASTTMELSVISTGGKQ